MLHSTRRRLAGLASQDRHRRWERRRSVSLRPWIEGLEDRTVLSTILWDSTNHPTGGDWDTGTNWVGGQVPTSTQDVVINLPRQRHGDAQQRRHRHGEQPDDERKYEYQHWWRHAVAGHDILDRREPDPDRRNAHRRRHVDDHRADDLDGRDDVGHGHDQRQRRAHPRAPPARATRSSSAAARSTTPAPPRWPAANPTSYGLFLAAGATFDNKPGASFAFITDASILDHGGTPAGGTFINEGTLSKTGGTGTSTRVGVPLNDTGSGTIQANSGTLSLQGGGTFSGIGHAGGGARRHARLRRGDVTPWRRRHGTVLSGTGAVTHHRRHRSTSRPARRPSPRRRSPVSGGTIGGAGTLTVSGPMTWTGGTMSGTGTTNANGGLTLGAAGASDQEFLSGRTLNNAGAATLAGSQPHATACTSPRAPRSTTSRAPASPSPPTRSILEQRRHPGTAAPSSTRGR